ncbi:MAG TPA: hypothetical protein PKE12_07660 [Kiritimatiellia bacterium]|nr:hypothetical protein [Kiritimatiellia bacterium]
MKRITSAALGFLLVVQGAAAAPSVEDYALVAPGICIVQDEEARTVWLRALAHFEAEAYGDARQDFLRCLNRCPGDAAARHLAALCAWAEGDHPLAIRWLAQLQRQGNASPATSAALGALYAESGTDSVVIGWLRRGMDGLDAAEKAYWVTRPAFSAFWRNPSPAWREFIEESGLSIEAAVTRALAAKPVVEAPERPVPEPRGVTLHLTPFNPALDSIEQAAEMRKLLNQRLIERIRTVVDIPVAEEIMEDELVTVDQALEEP